MSFAIEIGLFWHYLQNGCRLLPDDLKRFLLPGGVAFAPGLCDAVQAAVDINACRVYAASVQVGADDGNLSREWTAAPRAALRASERVSEQATQRGEADRARKREQEREREREKGR